MKLDLKCPPPPPYIQTVYHYARANVSSLKSSLTQFDWAHHLNSFDDPLKQVEFFGQTLLNVANNFIPHNEKVFVPRDPHTKACKTLSKNITENILDMPKEVLIQTKTTHRRL